jgi:hypothetical protein
MNPDSQQNSLASRAGQLGIVVAGVLLSILIYLVLVVIYLYAGSIWRHMFKQPEVYRKRNALRKEWNKQAAADEQRRQSFIRKLDEYTQAQGLSEEDRFRYTKLVSSCECSMEYHRLKPCL